MAEVTIEARPNGPYVVTGTIELRDTNGNIMPAQTRTVLCRCGASTKKPFCDGTHSKIGFQAAAQAVPTRLKTPQIPALQGYLQEMSECPPQRWTLLNPTESSPGSIRPTLKRQKAPVRRSNPRAGRRYGLALRLNTRPGSTLPQRTDAHSAAPARRSVQGRTVEDLQSGPSAGRSAARGRLAINL